jgi:5-methylthioribose kinase
MSDDTQDIAAGVIRMGLGTPKEIAPLSGGVSCDVYRVETDTHVAVIKRALPKLRVKADWRAPPERWRAEVAWLDLVFAIDPYWVPRVYAEDPEGQMFAMEYLYPDRHPVWKAELAEGRAGGFYAQMVGERLARIHAETAGKADIAAKFDNGAQFHALRLEPYLLFTAEKHPFVQQAIRDEVARIASSRIALMQGDISPKNILCGPSGPVFLDAETACYGDPAFDVAFCMNHFLLKAVWHPECTHEYAASFAAMRDAYLGGVTWEDPVAIDRRVARLLPMLFLARVDGKSPVEYLTDDESRAFVRGAAMQMIVEPPANLAVLAESYFPVAGQR